MNGGSSKGGKKIGGPPPSKSFGGAKQKRAFGTNITNRANKDGGLGGVKAAHKPRMPKRATRTTKVLLEPEYTAPKGVDQEYSDPIEPALDACFASLLGAGSGHTCKKQGGVMLSPPASPVR
jgi:hypothetical protein